MEAFLPPVWFGLLGLILFIYVILDGAALGVGLLSLGCRDEGERSLVLGAIGPVWHAGQTWLVVLGGLLFGAFPAAYALVFSGLYLPVFLMLAGFIFRAAALEFREEARDQKTWGLACGWGSLLAAAAQGLLLGSLLQGLTGPEVNSAGGIGDWLRPFPVLTAAGLVCGYALLGAAYLILKSEGDMQARSRVLAGRAAMLTLTFMAVLAPFASFRFPHLRQEGLRWALLLAAAFVLIIAGFLRSLGQRRDAAPFLWGAGLFGLAFTALAWSLYPLVIPPQLTIIAAAADPLTLKVMLAVVGPLLPVMIWYNACQHRVFWGKTPQRGGYED